MFISEKEFKSTRGGGKGSARAWTWTWTWRWSCISKLEAGNGVKAKKRVKFVSPARWDGIDRWPGNPENSRRRLNPQLT